MEGGRRGGEGRREGGSRGGGREEGIVYHRHYVIGAVHIHTLNCRKNEATRTGTTAVNNTTFKACHGIRSCVLYDNKQMYTYQPEKEGARRGISLELHIQLTLSRILHCVTCYEGACVVWSS